MDYYPSRARALVQNITDGIIEANRSEELSQVKSTGDFSATQLQEYQAKLQDAENRLKGFRDTAARTQVEPSAVTDQNAQAARDLRQTAKSDAEAEATAVGSAEQVLQAQGVQPAGLASVLAAPGPATLEAEAKQLEADYARATLIEGSASGAGSQGLAIRLARQVDSIGVAVNAELGKRDLSPAAGPAALEYLLAITRRDLAQARLDTYDAQLANYTDRAQATGPQDDLTYQRLEQEVQTYRDLESAFISQLTSSQISEAFGSSKVGEKITVLEPAQHPFKPVRPKRMQIVILSIVAGLAVGMTGAIFLEQHDPSFHDVRDIERNLNLPVLGTMPGMGRIGRLSESVRRGESRLRAAQAERAIQEYFAGSPGYQEFRKLVLRLVQMNGQEARTILVTSARRGEGKSTTASCLALALARELPRERVILADLDTRKPILAPFFGIDRDEVDGIVAPLEQRWDGDGLADLPVPNLRLFAALKREGPSDDIVTVESARWLLENLRARADRVIIDSPPNLPVPDALILGQYVDGVIMVVAAGTTPRETVRRSVELQRHFRENIFGLVLNNRLEVLPYYYHPSHYGYGYAKRG